MVDISNKKLIIFDMDGLFIDSEFVYAIGWERALRHYHVKVSENFVSSLKGQGAKDNDQAIFEMCKDKSLVKKIRQYRTDYFWQEVKNGNVKLNYFALEISNLLRNNGFELALASSSFIEVVDPLLESQDLLNYFDYKVTGSDVSFVKPDPAIYTKTLELAKCHPSEALAFEDSLYGVMAANAASVDVCHIGESNENVKKFSFASYTNLKDAYYSIFDNKK